MKQKLSITIDEEKVKKINEMLKDSRFRSMSHVFEFSLERFLNEDKELNKLNGGIKK
jgi:Arc/MetJ-type ribon-helix-helix transcriptional regulator